MNRLSKMVFVAGLALMGALATPISTYAAASDEKSSPTATAPSAEPTTAALEEQIRQQTLVLNEMREMLLKQQAEIDALKRQVNGAAPVVAVAPVVTAVPAESTTTVAAAPSATPSAAPQDAEAVAKRVEAIEKRLGNLKYTGDISMRYEGFYNQGFDAIADQGPRNRFRARVRLGLTGEIAKNFDWGLRVTSGSFDNPVSTQQSFTDFYDRKPIALDRAYLHFDSKTKGANLELVAGKFEAPWKRTEVTFDEDVQPEGFAETVAIGTGKATPLRTIKLTAWQLPFRERSIGADAVILGGQILTDWKFSDNWAATVSGAFHDFEQVDVIPPATNVSPTLVNAGFDYGTTNATVLNPVTGLLEYRSEYRVIDAIAELRYAGFGSRWPLVLRGDFIHNTSAYNKERDGGTVEALLGRRSEKGDVAFDYLFWKVERDAFPSVFQESEVTIQTNSLTHAIRARYLVEKQVELAVRYFATRRLNTLSPENRWLQHLQLDVQYRF